MCTKVVVTVMGGCVVVNNQRAELTLKLDERVGLVVKARFRLLFLSETFELKLRILSIRMTK